jgi:hypothetical protein
LDVCWDQVTTDLDGVPLTSNLVVSSYKLWACNSPSASCLKSEASAIGTVTAPFPALPGKICASITGRAVPSSYFATAVNIIGESGESVTLKVTPPNVPKNPGLR